MTLPVSLIARENNKLGVNPPKLVSCPLLQPRCPGEQGSAWAGPAPRGQLVFTAKGIPPQLPVCRASQKAQVTDFAKKPKKSTFKSVVVMSGDRAVKENGTEYQLKLAS